MAGFGAGLGAAGATLAEGAAGVTVFGAGLTAGLLAGFGWGLGAGLLATVAGFGAGLTAGFDWAEAKGIPVNIKANTDRRV